MKPKFNFLLILALSLLTGAIVTLCAGLGSVAHLSNRETYESEEEVMSVLLNGTGRASVVFSDRAPGDPGRYINRLRMDLYPKEGKPLDLIITVTVNDPETGISEKVIRDKNPALVRTEVIRLDMEHVTAVTVETADRAPFSVGKVGIDNAFHFSLYLFLFITAVMIALLYTGRSLFRSVRFRTEKKNTAVLRESVSAVKETLFTEKAAHVFPRLFLAAALPVGLALAFCLPRSKVGCDEETHLQAVLQIASFPSNELHLSDGIMHQITVTEYNNPTAQPGGSDEQQELNAALDSITDYREGIRTPDFSVLWNRIPAYFTMAVALKAGKGLELPWDVLLLITRIANLLTYIGLVWLALKILPSGHALMALLALMPQNLFLAATVSYDPFVTGCLYVGMAYCLRLLTGSFYSAADAADETAVKKKKRAFLRDTLLMALFFVLGCLPKAVYVPLLLLALMIPFRRVESRKLRTAFTVTVIVLAAAAFLAFILPTLLAPSESGDIRGGAVSEADQITFILGHPFTYAGLLLSQMFRWLPQCFFGPDCTTFMGHLVDGNSAYRGCFIPVLAMLALLVAAGIILMAAKKRKPVLSLPERGWTLLMCFGASVLIWTAMYVAFTEPGAAEIGGVQGRYFIPLMFPLYFALGAEMPSEPYLPEPRQAELPAEQKPRQAGTETGPETSRKKPGGRFAAGFLCLVRKEQLWYHIMMLAVIITLAVQYLQAVVIPCCL